MLEVDLETVRLFLHVLAATIWVGGQLVLAALVSPLRRHAADSPGVAARAFNPVAWSAYAVLVVTGLWNIAAEWDDAEEAWRTTLWVKLAAVTASGVTAFLHTRATTARGRAVWGALTGATALLALFLGVLLGSGGAG
jgi:putative copper export protein